MRNHLTHSPGAGGAWVGLDFDALLEALTGRGCHVAAEADVAGLAEVRFGAAVDRPGVVVVSPRALSRQLDLRRSALVPNTELGKLASKATTGWPTCTSPRRCRTRTAGRGTKWSGGLGEYLEHVDRLVTPELIILGGGVSKDIAKYADLLDIRDHSAPAQLRGSAGNVGAASLVA